MMIYKLKINSLIALTILISTHSVRATPSTFLDDISGVTIENIPIENSTNNRHKELSGSNIKKEKISKPSSNHPTNNKSTDSLSQKKTTIVPSPNKLCRATQATDKSRNADAQQITNLQKQLAQQKKKEINLGNKNNLVSYSLGVFYFNQITLDIQRIKNSHIKISEEALLQGIDDAVNGNLKVSSKDISKHVELVNNKLITQSKHIDKKIKSNNKNHEYLPDGSYFVIEKKGKSSYKKGDIVRFNIFAKKIDGTPIMNSMQRTTIYDDNTETLLNKVISSSFKGGISTLRGNARNLYSSLPPTIKSDDMVSITFELLP